MSHTHRASKQQYSLASFPRPRSCHQAVAADNSLRRKVAKEIEDSTNQLKQTRQKHTHTMVKKKNFLVTP